MKKGIIGVLVIALAMLSTAFAQVLPKDARERIIKATVMLLPTDAKGKLDGSLGSGTIISPLGYILTNYHVVGDTDNRTLSPWIQIRTIRFVDQEPEVAYWGKVVVADPTLDLAIVHIEEDKNEKPVSNLNLPYAELGDSNSMTIGDPIFIFGFQGTGGMTLTFSKGSVGGFTGEDLESSGKQWLKHDAQTGPGNSGGGAYDENGLLIGVHSAGVSGDHNSRTGFMRPLALAWGLITPNVPRFVVRGPSQSSGQSTAGKGTSGNSTSGTSTSGNSTSGTTTTSNGAANTNSSGNWPPKLAVGQNYQVALKGQSLSETWTVDLNAKDSDGDPKGMATSGNRKQSVFMYYDAKSDRVWVDIVQNDKSTTSCAFDKDGVKTAVWSGRAYTFKDSSSDGQRIGDCTATLKTGVVAQTPNTGQNGTQGTTSGNGSVTWPVNPQVGQTWAFNIKGSGTWVVALSKRSEKGNPTGTATSPKNEKWTGFFYYDTAKKEAWLDLTKDGKYYLSCLFEPGSLKGSTLAGVAYEFKDENDEQGTELGDCLASRR